jgi:preprotein translocase subunit SecG
MLHTLLTVLQVICCAAIIGLVLLQRGKGADAGAGFGAGASGTVFGARGASTALSRATAIFAAIFMINSLLLAYLGSKSPAEQPKSILDEAASVQHSVPPPGAIKPVPVSPTATGTSTPAPATAPNAGTAAPTVSAPPPAAPTPNPSSQSPPAVAPAPEPPAAPAK